MSSNNYGNFNNFNLSYENNHEGSNNLSIDDVIINICRYNYFDFLKKKNVVGVGLGYKVCKGRNTSEKCIKVFVSKKYPYYDINATDFIDSTYQGFKTDVVESGEFKVLSLTDKTRPVTGGYSVSPPSKLFAGTLGCLVTDDGNSFYLLSNNHVLAGENTLKIGTPIIQPAVVDGGKDSNDVIATLSKFIHIKFEAPGELPENEVDCAIAKVIDRTQVRPEIDRIGIPSGLANPQLSLDVQRTGRTTGHSNGIITAIGSTILLEFSFGQKGLFTNQIVTSDISKPGDSGALLMDNDKNAIGLLCGGSTFYSFYNPIKPILSYLNVKLVIK